MSDGHTETVNTSSDSSGRQFQQLYEQKNWDGAYQALQQQCLTPVTPGIAAAPSNSPSQLFQLGERLLLGPPQEQLAAAHCHYNAGVVALKQKNLPLARMHWEQAQLFGLRDYSLTHNLTLVRELLGTRQIEAQGWDDWLLAQARDHLMTPAPLRDWLLALLIVVCSLLLFFQQVLGKLRLLAGPLSWQAQRRLDRQVRSTTPVSTSTGMAPSAGLALSLPSDRMETFDAEATQWWRPWRLMGSGIQRINPVSGLLSLATLSSKPLVLFLLLVFFTGLQFAPDWYAVSFSSSPAGFLLLEKATLREGPSALYDARAEVPAGVKLELGQRRAGFIEVIRPYSLRGWVEDAAGLGQILERKVNN